MEFVKQKRLWENALSVERAQVKSLQGDVQRLNEVRTALEDELGRLRPLVGLPEEVRNGIRMQNVFRLS
jgi:hypothetical protein